MNEFALIEKYFAPLSHDGLQDDAAVLSIPAGYELVVSSDTLNAGTHFLEEASPADIAYKALRSNLSDLAATGADPLSYQLNIAFPRKPDEEWLQKFAKALAEDQNTFGIFCSGGDTTSIKGPLSISITVLGLVPEGKAVKRDGAKEGDILILTGPVGDAWVGLQILQGKLKTEDDAHFIHAYYKPQPRLDLNEVVRRHAHAAIDISDGLVAEIEHICKASNLTVELQISKISFSPEAMKLLHTQKIKPEDLLTGGDDYQLLLAVSPEAALHFPYAPIGRFLAGPAKVNVFDAQNRPLTLSHKGWAHF
jgi:thiamine-monophosphate kinase